MPVPKKPVAMTVYIHPDTSRKVERYIKTVMRPKSQAVDMLLLLGLEYVRESGKIMPDNAKPIPPRVQSEHGRGPGRPIGSKDTKPRARRAPVKKKKAAAKRRPASRSSSAAKPAG